MSEDLATVETPDGLGLRQALSWRRWHSTPGSRRRVATWSTALVGLIPIHVLVFAMTGSIWSLLAVPLNPLALYVSLRAWAYGDLYLYVIAIVMVFAGNFLPFYLL